MKAIIVNKDGKEYEIELNEGIDLSISFGAKEAVLAWGSEPTRFNPVQYGDWIGAVNQGASVNFFDVHLNPHGQGTHTEWVGHILPERGSVNSVFKSFFCFASVWDTRLDDSGEASLDENWKPLGGEEAVLLRTLPAGFLDAGYNFRGKNPPYIAVKTIEMLRDYGVQHILVDLPSVDPEEDGGALAAHHAWWFTPSGERRDHCTISEFVALPSKVHEGLYFMNLQLAPLENDAAPSRPLLFELKEKR